jgi:hypothetical protein
MIETTITLADGEGRLPLDRWLVWPPVLSAVLITFWYLLGSLRRTVSPMAPQGASIPDWKTRRQLRPLMGWK